MQTFLNYICKGLCNIGAIDVDVKKLFPSVTFVTNKKARAFVAVKHFLAFVRLGGKYSPRTKRSSLLVRSVCEEDEKVLLYWLLEIGS